MSQAPTPDQLFDVPPDQRIWVVRAEAGEYLPHFVSAEMIAIGHLDVLNITVTADHPFEFTSQIESNLIEGLISLEQGPATITSIVEQIRTFVNGIQIGDMVICPTPRSEILRVGIVIADAVYDQTPVAAALPGGEATVVDFGLRRQVRWGPPLSGDDLPYTVIRSFRARQTVFNIDRHWEAIYNALLPMFTRNGNLYLSFKVDQSERIRNASVAIFFQFLTEIEAMLSYHYQEWDEAAFAKHLQVLNQNDQLRLSTKAQFQSIGSIAAALENLKPNETIEYAILIYTMLFGRKWEGLLDLQTRHKLVEFFLNRWSKRGGGRAQADLRLEPPNFDAHAVTDALPETPPKASWKNRRQ